MPTGGGTGRYGCERSWGGQNGRGGSASGWTPKCIEKKLSTRLSMCKKEWGESWGLLTFGTAQLLLSVVGAWGGVEH